jgi:hypothetical protein
VASQKGWPLKRGISASENLLNMADFGLHGAKNDVKCVLLQKITGYWPHKRGKIDKVRQKNVASGPKRGVASH